MLPWLFGDDFVKMEIEKNYPNYKAWNERLLARPAVQKVIKAKQEAMAAGH